MVLGKHSHRFDSVINLQFKSTLESKSQQPIIAAAVAALGLIGVALSSGKSDVGSAPTKEAKAASTEAVEAVDVSIPYNAAAKLEYNKLMSGTFDAASFAKFQFIYETKVVAEVTAKKVARDCQLEIERLQAIAAKADAEIAELK
jgi:hypothetical protein